MANLHVEELNNGGALTIDTLAMMVVRGFQHVDNQLDRIEQLLLAEHRQHIEQLERQMKELKMERTTRY